MVTVRVESLKIGAFNVLSKVYFSRGKT